MAWSVVDCGEDSERKRPIACLNGCALGFLTGFDRDGRQVGLDGMLTGM